MEMQINLTDKAKEELQNILKQKDSVDKPVRIYVAGVG
jgi:Fe-S cluster assembly iron-binding protein IscA